MRLASFVVVCLSGFYLLAGAAAGDKADDPAVKDRDVIRVGRDGRHFVFSTSGARFIPWGFNYDHDASNRLLEDYWNQEWDAFSAISEIHQRPVEFTWAQ